MSLANESYLLRLPKPQITPALDPEYRPAALVNRLFLQSVHECGGGVPAPIALERSDGSVSYHAAKVLPDNHPDSPGNFTYLERLVKFLLWSRGGSRIYFGGPPALGERLRRHYIESSTGRFDASIMGAKIYDTPFEVRIVAPDAVPQARERSAPLGRHFDGCRIGFDLGASDRKVAAVRDGKTVFSEELPWDPRSQSDPQWHFAQIMESLQRAAAHLPRVDAIGGSSAGVYVQNEVKVASLFRGVPEPLFQSRVKPLFLELQRAWRGIPFEVVNDGEVTALAGSMAIEESAVLGLALGSSQAAGYVNPEGNITTWLNELAFAPVDYNPAAPIDEWSGDYGCGVQYFSQQAVGRLIAVAGLEIDPLLGLPEKLVQVQQRMAGGDQRVARIYETIGVYLGYAVAHYADFYDFRHVLILGRVTTGAGGDLIVREAQKVLASEFPGMRTQFHIPDETQKRHGQAMAAASLPEIPPPAEQSSS